MKLLFFILLMLLQVSFDALAQLTIFNVPSGDVVKKDKVFIQHESQFRTKEDGQYWNATNYVSVGLGDDFELDVTSFNINSPAQKNASIGFGGKKLLPINIAEYKKYQPQITIGGMVPFSIQGNGVGHWIYGAANIIIPQSNTRITAGISNGTKQIFGENSTAFIGGFEQKFTSKLSYVADWYSGNSSYGLIATGLSYSFDNEVILMGGYQIPNSKKVGKNSFIIEIGKGF